MPSPRHLSGRRLLLASLTGSERRGNSVPGARPRAVAPSSQRTSSPARIPDWEREEGRLRPWRPASCRRPVTMMFLFGCLALAPPFLTLLSRGTSHLPGPTQPARPVPVGLWILRGLTPAAPAIPLAAPGLRV